MLFTATASLIRHSAAALLTIALSAAWMVSAALAAPAATDWRSEVLYFVLVDRYADGKVNPDPALVRPAEPGYFHGGDLVGLTGRLDELKELGITALWLNPLVRNIPRYVGNDFADWGYHGYWAEDFTTLDPRFGTETELKTLVDAAHARGIKVLLDVVYNHPGYGSRYETDPRYAGWVRTGKDCGQDDETRCLYGLPDFRLERQDVREHLFQAHLGLAKRVGLDGFRLDTVGHVPKSFWAEHRARVRRELGSNFFLLGEVWGGDAESLGEGYFQPDLLDAGFDFSFRGEAIAFVNGRGRAQAFAAAWRKREAVTPGHVLAHYLSSHDQPGAILEVEGDVQRFRMLAAMQFAASGLPVIFYGEEVGRWIGDWPANRSNMPWGQRPLGPGQGVLRDEGLRDDYRRLIALRKAHPELARGTTEVRYAEADTLVLARTLGEQQTLVVIHRGPTLRYLPLEALGIQDHRQWQVGWPAQAGFEYLRDDDLWKWRAPSHSVSFIHRRVP